MLAVHLGATPWEADADPGSVARGVAEPRGSDTPCVDPRLLHRHPVPDTDHTLSTAPLCDSQALQHQQPPNQHARLSTARYEEEEDNDFLKTGRVFTEATPFETDSSSSPDQDGPWSRRASETAEDVSTAATTPLKSPDQLPPSLGTVTAAAAAAAANPIPAASSTGRFACQEVDCPLQFSSQKDLDRHFESVHGVADLAKFQCACGKLDPRKDNHGRHVRTCRRSRPTSFRCRCGTTSERAKAHLKHIAAWRRRRGCPP